LKDNLAQKSERRGHPRIQREDAITAKAVVGNCSSCLF